MGDRTSCTLYIYGTTTAALWADVEKALDEFSPDDDGNEEGGYFWFNEVNYGGLDEDVEATLIAAGLSYQWQWEQGGGYSEGIKLYDADTKETAEFCAIDHEIALPVSLLTSDNIEVARKWAAWIKASKTWEVIG